MAGIAIAIDIGTSGIRAQAIDYSTHEIISTVITTHHPLPGGNVIDHLYFALELGIDTSRSILIHAINQVIVNLRIPLREIERFAVCGNPIQLSIFTGDEIRDLAFAGKRKLDYLGISIPDREARILPATVFTGLNIPSSCKVIIPPAVSHEVGADALALIIKTGMVENNNCCSIAIDYGTNAEIALFAGGNIFTGSTAAGPALEGQQIHCGVLALPGAISDLVKEEHYHRIIQLNNDIVPVNGPLIDLKTAGWVQPGESNNPVGITGTGTIAALYEAMEGGLVQLPSITTPDHLLHFGTDIFLDEHDLEEAGKAIGAIRAGYLTLCHEAGISPEEIKIAYMAGAAGTYVDAHKAYQLGLLPPRVQTIFQVGNTSLAMARDLVLNNSALETMTILANHLKEHYCLFASSKIFKNLYLLEYSFWTEGMPMNLYRDMLRKYHLADLPPVSGSPRVVRMVERDIDDLGQMGLVILDDIGIEMHTGFSGCTECNRCITDCPENAIVLNDKLSGLSFTLNPSRCLGITCRRCERVCPEKIFCLKDFFNRASLGEIQAYIEDK